MNKKIFCFLILFFLRPIKTCKSHLIKGVAALGFQYNNGSSWAMLCQSTPFGTIPGKIDGNKGAYYVWEGKDRSCHEWTPVGGILYPVDPGCDDIFLPVDCHPKGLSKKDNQPLYNAIIPGKHGMIPGYATSDLANAYYGFGWKQHCAEGLFYVIC